MIIIYSNIEKKDLYRLASLNLLNNLTITKSIILDIPTLNNGKIKVITMLVINIEIENSYTR